MTRIDNTQAFCMILTNQYGTLVRRFRAKNYPSKDEALRIAQENGWLQPEDKIEVQHEDQGDVPVYV